MKITILGNNSALPAYGRNPTAQVVQIANEILLLDCGEGTQMRLKLYEIKSQRINHIFISHAHGDHYFGLVALISSMSLLGRTNKLFLYCNEFIKQVIDLQLQWDLGFQIEYVFLKENEEKVLISNEQFEVRCFPVFHSVATHGFYFLEKNRKRRLLPEKVQEFEIPQYFYKQLTSGLDYVDKNGVTIKNEWVTLEGLSDKSYAFAADTIFNVDICKYFMHTDLLYHETTYLKVDEAKAKLRFHSTAHQAACIARQADCKQLIIGHFSSKYKDLNPFLTEAKEVFENTALALEGITFVV